MGVEGEEGFWQMVVGGKKGAWGRRDNMGKIPGMFI